MFCRPSPLFDTLMQHRQYPKSELECYYTASAHCLFHKWDLCSYHWCYVVVPHGWPSDLFYRCAWNLHGFPSPTFTPILQYGHFSMSETYIWLYGAMKTRSDGWVVCFIRYWNAYIWKCQNPIFTSLLQNVPSLKSESHIPFISTAPTFPQVLAFTTSYCHYTDVFECFRLMIIILVLDIVSQMSALYV